MTEVRYGAGPRAGRALSRGPALANQDWYALTPYSLAPSAWLATQFHSPEEQKGMVLVFRREEAAKAVLQVSLHGLTPQAQYDLTWQVRARPSGFWARR